jgi:undecaprenyl-diphosphatase
MWQRISAAERPLLRTTVAPARAPVSRMVTGIGGPRFMLAATTAVGLVTRSTARGGLRPVLVLATGLRVRRSLCEAVRRPRPPQEWWRVEPDGYSFPSKHMTTVVIGVGLLLEMLPEPRARQWRLPAAGVVAVVAASRLRLGVHWPSDLLGGLAFGAGWLWLARRLGVVPGRVPRIKLPAARGTLVPR